MIGKRLESLRKNMEMTQADVARVLSVVPNTISSYELNVTSPDDENKIKLAKLFHVSVDYLIGLTDDPTPYPPVDNKGVVIIIENLSPSKIKKIQDYIKKVENE